MNLKEISIENLEGVQDLMQVGCLITNRRGGHELSIVSLETLHLNLLEGSCAEQFDYFEGERV
jgi:hypothetical protein